ncbi:hypothetical protein N2152v2_001114 [Parachlorella kessleri]
MATFTFTGMRAALPRVTPFTSRPQPIKLSLPSFSGMKLAKGLPGHQCTESSLQAPQNGIKVFAMRHGNKKAKLNKPADQRKALLRSLTTEVLRHGKIKTTKVRAKAVRKYVDKMITLAKEGSLHARRQALSFVYDAKIVTSLFEQAPKRYADRQGGYCRVTSEVMPRRGDNAEMANIELV